MHAGSADKQSELVLKGQLGTWWIMSALEMANEDVLAQILQIYIFISMCPFRVCRSVCRLLCLSVVMPVCLLSPPAPQSAPLTHFIIPVPPAISHFRKIPLVYSAFLRVSVRPAETPSAGRPLIHCNFPPPHLKWGII